MIHASIQKICVCGAGTMGSGIAQVCVSAGFSTILFDINEEVLIKGKQHIEKGLQLLVEKQKITAEEHISALQRIQYINNINNCVADLVIEAIVEKLEVKTDLFNQLTTVNHDGVIFATNTSSLSISLLQQKIKCPERVVGMHFFNPAPVMKLVEIVKGEQTDDKIIQAIYQFIEALGKSPVLCKDAPGFIVNRIARPYYLEAMKLVEQGVATFESVDTIMEASGFRMGPFKLMDLIGMDVNFAVSNIVWNELNQPDRLKPSPLQKKKVEAGELGRKTGKGFYQY